MDKDQKERLKTLLLSGAVSGGVLGGAGSLLSGAKSFGSVGKAAALGAGLSSLLAGGSGYIGESVMPDPDPDDPSAFTNRGAVGGAIAGGALGGGLGGVLGSRNKYSAPIRKSLMNRFEGGLLSKGIGKVKGAGLGAAALGLGGALIGGFQGADEGMQADFVNNMRQKQKEEQLRKALRELS